MTPRLQTALINLRSAVMQGLVHDYPQLKDSLRDVCEALERADVGVAHDPREQPARDRASATSAANEDVFDPIAASIRAHLALETLRSNSPAIAGEVNDAANKVLLDFLTRCQ
jgi:hypothetical protein